MQLAETARRRWLGQQSNAALLQGGRRGYADDAGSLKKTVMYDYHVENGGKMVPFAGWSMPIQYKDSIMDSTTNCRSHGSLFDVSHMCGLSLKGPDAIPFLETLVVADIQALPPGTGTLSVFTNENGGVIDDTVITKVRKEGRKEERLLTMGDFLLSILGAYVEIRSEFHMHCIGLYILSSID